MRDVKTFNATAHHRYLKRNGLFVSRLNWLEQIIRQGSYFKRERTQCEVCNNNIDIAESYPTINDGYICAACLKEATFSNYWESLV